MSNSMADKLTRIAVNTQLIYNAGYEKGKSEGGGVEDLNDVLDAQEQAIAELSAILDEKASGGNTEAAYEQGVADGKKAEHDAFWDAFQSNGARTYYRYAFNFAGWTEANFKPKYDIIPEGEITQMFNTTNINADLVEICEKQGIVIDFSKITQFEYVFQNSKFTRVGVIDVSNATKFVSVFYSAKGLVTIDKIIISSKCVTITTPFNLCSALENVIFEGKIAANGLNLQWSTKLSKASIESIISCLSTETSGKSITLSQTAVNNAFTDEEWATLIATRSNWTISLV